MTKNEIRREYPHKSREEILEMYKQADINEQDSYGESLLHLAANFADSLAIEYLLSKGMDPNVETSLGERPLHFLAKENRYYEVNQEEVKKCASLLLEAKASTMRKDMDGRTAVIVAAEEGRYEILEVMLEKGSKLIMTDKEGNNALHIACKSIPNPRFCKAEEEERYLKTVQILLKGGLDPEAKNNYNQTAIDISIEKGNKKMTALLQGMYEEGNQESLAVKTGGMNLYQAIEKADYEAVKANLELGADKNMPSDEEGNFHGMSPLGMACYLLDLESVKLLLESGANPNYKNAEGETAISRWFRYLGDFYFHFEKLEKNIPQQIFKLLLQYGLDVNDKIDQEENTVLTKAAKYIDRASNYNGKTLCGIILKALLAENCDVNVSNSEGQTALMHLCMSHGDEVEDILIQLLEMEADIGAVDKYGNTVLMYAAKNSNKLTGKAVAELLFDFGEVNVSAVNNEGKSAMEIATESDNEELLKYLLMKE
ncbi:MAG: ankyrin repeat domain-containing protein [Fusobacterium necrophorum]|nr:ankyrin repeat domain-containing protein [Fusobacterium necrophorum]